MAEIRYGHRNGPGKGREYPVAASQYLGRRGGKFCYLAAGNLNTCASACSIIAGWVESPKDASGYNSWKSSATAGKDKVFLISGLEDVFELPCSEGIASLAVTHIGQGADLHESGGNATYLTEQEARLGMTASPLSIVDVDLTNKTVFVKIKPGSLQSV